MWHERDWCSFDGLFWSEPSMQFNYPCATKYFLPADWTLSTELFVAFICNLKPVSDLCPKSLYAIRVSPNFSKIYEEWVRQKSDEFHKNQIGRFHDWRWVAIKRSEVDMDTLRETMVDKKRPGKWMAGIWPRKKPVMAAGEGCAQCPPR